MVPSERPSALEPVPTLLDRVRAELSHEFDLSRPVRVSRAPGRLDVMGGIAEYTGSTVCELPLQCGAAVALQARSDRDVHVLNLNLREKSLPWGYGISLDALAEVPGKYWKTFSDPRYQWAGHVAGCLAILHEQRFVNLADPAIKGINVAFFSTIPFNMGAASSAALQVASMINLRDHFDLLNPAAGRSLRIANASAINPMKLAELCQVVQSRVIGLPCGIVDHVTSCWGEAGMLLRMICQPHELQPPQKIPDGVHFIGITTGMKSIVADAYIHTRTAAFMAHKLILEKMRQIGAAAGRRLARDPLNGYLANIDLDDYKRIFRPALPEQMRGKDFIEKYGPTVDPASRIDPDVVYQIVHAADHHVLEARRVTNFCKFLDEAAAAPDPGRRGFALDKAGHLMYASHQSYEHDAMLSTKECDLLVKLVRQRERAGLYGARITGRGAGGTVAVLADVSARADNAIGEIAAEYEKQTGSKSKLLSGSSAGAWHVGTELYSLPSPPYSGERVG